MVLERMSRMHKNKKGKLVTKGRKPKDATVYKRYSRERGGIDGYKHREQVLKPLLMPFVNELKKQGRDVSVVENNAPARSQRHRQPLLQNVR
jgi:hypothetical protein